MKKPTRLQEVQHHEITITLGADLWIWISAVMASSLALAAGNLSLGVQLGALAHEMLQELPPERVRMFQSSIKAALSPFQAPDR